MKLYRIIANNFRCFKSINLTLPPNGLFLIQGENNEDHIGSNGAGKTTLLDTIVWCLYGRSAEGAKAEDLQMDGTKAGYSVGLFFDDKTFIQRFWPGKGMPIKLDGKAATQQEIDTKVGLTFEQFMLSVMMSQEGREHFLDLTPGKKLDFLSTVFELNRWSEYADLCKSKIKDIVIEREKLELQHQMQAGELATLATNQTDLQQKANAWEITATEFRVDTQKELDSLQSQYDQWSLENEKQIKEIRERIEQLKKTEPDITEKNSLVEKEREIQGKISELEGTLSGLSSISLREVDNDIAIKKADALRIATQAQRLIEATNTVCSVCEQPISGDHVTKCCEDLFAQLEGIQQNIVPQETKKGEIEVQISELKQQVLGLQEQKQIVLRELQAFKFKEQTWRESSKLITDLESALGIPKQNPYEKQSEYLKQQLANEPTNPYIEQLRLSSERSKELEASIIAISDEIKIQNQQESDYTYWQKRFPLIRLAVLDEIIAELEVHLNQAISNFGLSEWTVNLDTERELKSEKNKIRKEVHLSLTRNNKDKKFIGLSGGEKQRLRIAMAFGLGDLIMARTDTPLQMKLLDEPTHSLSDVGIDSLLDYTNSMGDYYQVLIAEHGLTGLTRFDRIFNVVKNPQGISEVVIDDVGQHSVRGEPIPVS